MNLANFRTSLVEKYQSNLAHLPVEPQKELLEESGDLFRALDTLSRDERLEESAYAVELRRLYDTLSQDENIYDSLLQQDINDGERPLSIRSLIEKAWTSDHAARLDAEYAILTSVCLSPLPQPTLSNLILKGNQWIQDDPFTRSQ